MCRRDVSPRFKKYRLWHVQPIPRHVLNVCTRYSDILVQACVLTVVEADASFLSLASAVLQYRPQYHHLLREKK